MQIPQDLIEKWKRLRSHGDDIAVAKKLKTTAASISSGVWRAFKTQKCSDKLFKALRDHYNAKEKDLFTSKPQSDAK